MRLAVLTIGHASRALRVDDGEESSATRRAFPLSQARKHGTVFPADFVRSDHV